MCDRLPARFTFTEACGQYRTIGNSTTCNFNLEPHTYDLLYFVSDTMVYVGQLYVY